MTLTVCRLNASRLKCCLIVLFISSRRGVSVERDLVMERSSPERLCRSDLQGAGSFQARQQLEFSCSFGWALNADNCSTHVSSSPTAENRRREAVTGLRWLWMGSRRHARSFPSCSVRPAKSHTFRAGVRAGSSGSPWAVSGALVQRHQRKPLRGRMYNVVAVWVGVSSLINGGQRQEGIKRKPGAMGR